MLSRPIFNEFFILKHINSIMHESYVEKYSQDDGFKDVYANLVQGNHVEELDYRVHIKLLYHFGKLCVAEGEIVNVIREAHTYLITGHFLCRKSNCTNLEVKCLNICKRMFHVCY